jgi:hypothetical protein
VTQDVQTQILGWEQKIDFLKKQVDRKANVLKWIVGLGALAVFGPLVLSGLLAGAAALVIGAAVFAAVQLAPAGAKWLVNKRTELEIAEANRHLQALKAEARKNPVETLQNVYMEKESALNVVNGKIMKFATKVNEFGLKVNAMKRDFPQDAEAFQKIHEDMKELLERRREKWKVSRSELDAFAKQIERASAIWDMTQATADLRESAGHLEENFMQRLRRETALDSVQSSLAASMAELDQLMMEEIDLQPKLTHQPQDVIEVKATVKQEVRR